MTDAAGVLDATVRGQWGRLVALLLAQYRRLDLVEDALGDAVEAATRHWPSRGVPENPSAWLLTAARRRLLDQLRGESMARRRGALLITAAEQGVGTSPVMADPGGMVDDDLLRLVMMCAHPALSSEAASALALRLVVGVSTSDIARLFLVSEPTMAARITRAKKKVVTAGIPFTVPSAVDLPSRLDAVAQTAYLAYTAGYAPGSGPDLLRTELAGSAISLIRVTSAMRPEEPVVIALLALMLFQHSRRDARIDAEGALVLLRDQDRSRWHHNEIAEARSLLSHPALAGPLTEVAAGYTLQARIAAEHALAASSVATDWARIVATYGLLLQVAPSPSTRLARAVAVAECSGAADGLAALHDVDLPGSHRLPAVRAELLSRIGDVDRALVAYDEAIELCSNGAERAHLVLRRGELMHRKSRRSGDQARSRPG